VRPPRPVQSIVIPAASTTRGYAGNSRADRFLDIAAFALAQFKVRRDGLFR